MIPRLEAEESNQAAERIAVGTGATKHAGAVTRRWARQAAGEDGAAPAAKPKAAAMWASILGPLAGRVNVRMVPKVKRDG